MFRGRIRASRSALSISVEMPDVFISYARLDAELVRRLHGELAKRGNNVWVDWEDIPPASKFERDLEEGVAKSDSFVFVISPDSLDSSYCRKELSYADERNKRIVPVIHREVDRERLPESLRIRNWIPSGGRFDDDFDGGVAALVSAIETDLEWVRAHTEWGAQAEEWRTNDRDRSFLLRGTELAAAERWIAQQGKEPAPTGLQGEYVLASRRAASRRQRLTLAATGAALIIAVGLAIIAVAQRNEAVSQRDQALSRVLAGSASDNLTVDPELAMLLALEAVDIRATPEAEASLRQALGAWRVRLLIREHEGPVWRGAFNPDGELIATGESDSVVHVWKADTGEPVQTFRGRGRIAALGFSRDGDLVVAVPDVCGSCNGYSSTWNVPGARAWDIATGELALTGPSAVRSLDAGAGAADFDRLQAPGRPRGPLLPIRDATGRLLATLHGRFDTDFLRPIARTSDGTRIALGGHRPGIWDAGSGRLLVDLSRHLASSPGSSFVDVDFSPDGTQLAAMGTADTLVVSTETGDRIAKLADSGYAFGRVAFSPDGAQLLTAPDRGLVGLWEPATGRLLAALQGASAGVTSAVFSPDGAQVLMASADGTARSVEAAPAGLRLRMRRPAVAAAFSADGDRVATADRSGGTYLFDAASGELIATLGPPSRHFAPSVRPSSPYPRVRFNADGSLLFGGGSGGKARVWEAESGELVATLGDGATSDAIRVSRDERVLIISAQPFAVELWDLRSEALERRITRGITLGPTAAVSPDGGRLATFGTAGMIWDLDGGKLLERPMRAGEFIISAEFSPDGRYLVTVDSQGPIRLWDAESGRQVWQVDSETEGRQTAGFSDDGNLVSNGQEVWEAATGRRRASLSHGKSLASAGFSADGKFVLTSGGGKTLLWDVVTGEQLYEWSEGSLVVAEELFSPDGMRVLTAGRQAAHVYPCEVCGSLDELVALAEQRATRELTDRERATYGLE